MRSGMARDIALETEFLSKTHRQRRTSSLLLEELELCSLSRAMLRQEWIEKLLNMLKCHVEAFG